MKRIELAVYCPDGSDATSLYRALGPLRAMQREGRGFEPAVELELRRPVLGPKGQELTWDWLLGCDALLLQRPWLPLHTQLAVQAKMMGLGLWVDWDDDYLTIHPSNPNYHGFMHPGLRETLQQIGRLADVVTVTTEVLARRVELLCARERPTVRVVPNACRWPLRTGRRRERRVSWRGGASHELDITSVLKELAELARLPQFGKWEWAFLGDVPWQVEQAMPKERCLGGFGAEPWLYMEAMERLAPYVHIVPLARTAFNPCKSHLAWLEATAAGAVVIAPALEEWQRPGVVNYTDAKDFQKKLRGVMESYHEGEEHENVAVSRGEIGERYLEVEVNRLRWEVLEWLTTDRHGRTRTDTD